MSATGPRSPGGGYFGEKGAIRDPAAAQQLVPQQDVQPLVALAIVLWREANPWDIRRALQDAYGGTAEQRGGRRQVGEIVASA